MNKVKNGLDTTVKYELPVQTEIPSVISVPRAKMSDFFINNIKRKENLK